MSSIRRSDMGMIAVGALVIVAGTLVGISCTSGDNSPIKAPPVGIDYKTADTLEPEKLPYDKAELILAGTSYPVEVVKSGSKDRVEFKFVHHGEVVDHEAYHLTSQGFELVSGAGMTFEPPVPVLVFPLSVGESWEWSGRVSDGAGANARAHAKIDSAKESLNTPSGLFEAVKIILSLELLDTRPPIRKDMTFWFAPRKGLVKREFGTTSTRGPAAE